VKDYGFMLREDPAWGERAARVSKLTRDVTEYLDSIGLMAPSLDPELTLAYHSACSMQHGQQVRRQPRALLAAAGFDVREIPEGHICCGSAGTYNLLQPVLAGALRDRKAANIARLGPDVVATGNIGCLVQLEDAIDVPIVHTVELLDWVTGGPKPPALVAAAHRTPREPAPAPRAEEPVEEMA
jgi:glycolate oxidase iron-sulfur subunit